MNNVTSDRTDYIGAHIRPEVKEAIRAHAKSRGESISAWIAQTVEERLVEAGYDLSPKVDGPKEIIELAEAGAAE